MTRDLPTDFRTLELAAQHNAVAQNMAEEAFLEYVVGHKPAEYEDILGEIETGIIQAVVNLLVEHGEKDNDRVTAVVVRTITTFRDRLAQLIASGAGGRA